MRPYSDRESRNKFIANTFEKYLKGSVLNVGGGGKKHLLQYTNPLEYLELDIEGSPDIHIDLEKEYPINIKSNSFDTIICTDVLEHLDEFHRVFDELIRISKQYVIISLPNGIPNAKTIFKGTPYKGEAGKAGINVGLFSKQYGLPLTKPYDRHKWFFSYTEIENFIKSKSEELKFEIIDAFPINTYRFSLKNLFIKTLLNLLIGKKGIENYYYSTFWCVLGVKKIV